MNNTTDQRPLVLITNDDSINAAGIHHLAALAAEWAEVIVMAPKYPQSGKSSSLTFAQSLRIEAAQPHNAIPGVKYFAVDDGTPVDCVKIGLYKLSARRPDFIFSGINHGDNSGVNVVYSGTMGAAIEGAIEGIPSAGFSLLSHAADADFTLSADFIRGLMADIRKNPPAPGICLNINIPAGITPKGVKHCRTARTRWTDGYAAYTSPHGNEFYMLAGRMINEEPDATDTDQYWLERGYISVVPIDSDMTAR